MLNDLKIYVGFIMFFSISSRLVSPLRTNTESTLALSAISISVYKRSPIINISDLCTLFSLAINSIKSEFGFPNILYGSTPVVFSNTEMIVPISGIGPSSLGQKISQ